VLIIVARARNVWGREQFVASIIWVCWYGGVFSCVIGGAIVWNDGDGFRSSQTLNDIRSFSTDSLQLLNRLKREGRLFCGRILFHNC
jgi:hypothetical protein